MRFRYGSSRFVLLVGPYAIKIARFPIFFGIYRIIVWRREGILKEKIAANAAAPLNGMAKLLLSGICGNLREYRISRAYPGLPVAPTLRTFCGLVNVQRRAEPFLENEDRLEKIHPFAWLDDQSRYNSDIHRGDQFGWVDRRLVLIDYGSAQLEYYVGLQTRIDKVFKARVVAAFA